jgi:hypothetical protein
VDGAQRRRRFASDGSDVVRGKRPAGAQLVLDGPACPDEFHPQPDAAVDALGAVHGDDVRVADSGHQPAFLDHRRFQCVGAPLSAMQELERDRAIEFRIARAKNVAVGAPGRSSR